MPRVIPHDSRQFTVLVWAGMLWLMLTDAPVSQAQESRATDDLTVKSVKQRISDEAIEADRQVFRQLRAKLAAARSQGSLEQACALVKAEAWLNVSEEEYDENEEGDIVDVTLREAQRLLRSLDHAGDAMQNKTRLLKTPTTARPDLWLQLDQLRARDASCACNQLAQLEVQLSWADHEVQEGRQHARPYIEAAERLAESAKYEVEKACPVTASLPHVPSMPVKEPALVELPPAPVHEPGLSIPSPPPAVPEPPLPPASVSTPEPTITLATLPWSVHFSTNRSGISKSTAKVLDKVSAVLLKYPNAIISLEGHADQRGDAVYNKLLSERRTKAVKDYLVRAGINRDHLSTAALGNSRPLTSSRQNRDLAKNRRVVIVVVNIEQIRSEEQESDLQLDQRTPKKNSHPVERSTQPRAKGKQQKKNHSGRAR